MVFQHIALLPHRSVVDNAAFGLEARGVGKKERRARAFEKLELVGLEKWADRYPNELSGGMQQRVGLARALASDPSILLMDEPFSALDPVIRRDLQNQFLDLSQVMKKTTVFITHDLEEAMKLGTRIAIMRDAKIVQIGTSNEIVMKSADEYVRNFVSGISRQTILKAKNIMELSNGPRPHPVNVVAEARPEDFIASLVDKIAGNPGAVAIKDRGTLVGFVTLDALLGALRSR